jgi:hypothetical protein
VALKLKTYRTFEMDIQDFRELLAEYFAHKLIKDNKVKEQILTGLCIPGSINTRSLEELIKLSQQIDLRHYISNVLMQNNQLYSGESFRILVRVTKENLYDINDIQDICRAKYDTIDLSPIDFDVDNM